MCCYVKAMPRRPVFGVDAVNTAFLSGKVSHRFAIFGSTTTSTSLGPTFDTSLAILLNIKGVSGKGKIFNWMDFAR